MPTPREQKKGKKRINRWFEAAAGDPRNSQIEWPFKARLYEMPEDEGFIYKNWIGSMREAKPWRAMTYGRFAEQQRAVIGQLLHRLRVKVMVAVQEDVGEPKFGWVCYEWRGPLFVLHFIYIRSHYRNKRIATRLLESAGVTVGQTPIIATAWTKSIGYLIERWNLDFDFFHAWRETDAHHKHFDVVASSQPDGQGDGEPESHGDPGGGDAQD